MITGDELRKARQRKGITQEQLADITDFSPRQICRFENNKNLTKCDKYLRLFQTLQMLEEER